jgi:hypothetical protein
MSKQSSSIPAPPTRRVISGQGQHSMPAKGLKAHLAQLTQHAKEVKNYGGHPGFEVTGQSLQGAMSPGGASGADYQTTSTGNTGDSDSGGPSGY